MLKLNQQTVRNWIDAGTLPAVRVGRRVRIRRADLEQIIESGSQGAASAAPSAAPGPSAHDFWGGEPVWGAEPDPTFSGQTSAAASAAPPSAGDQDKQV